MKIRYALIVLASLSASPALFGESPSIRLERDAPVTLVLKQALSSETAHVNDRVEFEVMEDVSAGGAVVVARGSKAWGRIVDVVPSGRLMRNGRVSVDIESAIAADGTSIRLRASNAAHPATKSPRESTADELGALPALPVTMFRYGKPMQIPAGKVVTVYTAAPATIAVKPAQIPAQAVMAPQAAVKAGPLPAQIPAPAVAPQAAVKASLPPPVRSTPAAVAQTVPPASSARVVLQPASSTGFLPAVRSTPPLTLAPMTAPAATPSEPIVASSRKVMPAAAPPAPQQLAASNSVLPPVNPANGSPSAANSNSRLPAPAAQAPAAPRREPASASKGGTKKVLTILAVGAAAGLAGVLISKGHGGAQTAATAAGGNGPSTTVGLGGVSVGGPH